VLAYYFLIISKQGMSRQALDSKIEQWLADKWQCSVNFEIDDALNKLLALNLVAETDGLLHAVPVLQGIKYLDQRWDDYFQT
ncbi:MAG: DUF3754 domain-containing protein, partial [Gammaproteobacteria bacterium]|nr:DUF3754 domain-containing protein [Gammaproteobacteria bacterium]